MWNAGEKARQCAPQEEGHLLNLQVKSVFSYSQPKAQFSGVGVSGKRI